MSTLTKLSAEALADVRTDVREFNDTRAMRFERISARMKAHKGLTLQHYLAEGLKGTVNIGIAFSAEMYTANGFHASNYAFLGEHYASISVKKTASEQEKEVDRVILEVTTAEEAADKAANNAGDAFINKMKDDVIKDAKKAASLIIVDSPATLDAIVELEGIVKAMKERVLAAKETKTLVKSK